MISFALRLESRETFSLSLTASDQRRRRRLLESECRDLKADLLSLPQLQCHFASLTSTLIEELFARAIFPSPHVCRE